MTGEMSVAVFESLYPVDPMPEAIRLVRDGTVPVWIFAYGSLMWDPELRDAEARPALLRGYHRRFCLYSRDYRGTPRRPGLVLGLDRGGSCRGIAFRLPPEAIDRVWAREMTGRVYDMRRLRVDSAAGSLAAYAFTIRRDHPDYAPHLSLDDTARLILEGIGSRGACRDYLESTLRHLEEKGFADRALRRLAARVSELAAERGRG
jgi:cation transport protein ChaC